VRAFKAMVKAMHAAGIEVLLDMVFNHTSEGDERGSTQSLRGLDNSIYYMLDAASGSFLNFSGCGNTLNCNHPVVRNLILDSLRYWVTEMHVDGFRFDLASVLGRGRDGAVLSSPPLLETIAEDPVLGRTKLIAEAWDAAGLYQVGSFPHWGRWAEWNGRFRDDVRRFVRGEAGMTPQLATRLAGSSDLYQGGGRAPFHSVNFVTCHDGFTLADLTSYDHKHNQANGEDDRDGQNDNLSWNCGVEGPTASFAVQSLRRRQQKNFAALLLLSQGVPMILAGDELGRTQHGNNNAYCQDNATGWLDWRGLEANRDLLRFFQQLIAFRRAHRALRQREFLARSGQVAVAWYEPVGTPCTWSPASRTLGMHLSDRSDLDLYLMANAHWEEHRFQLPAPAWGRRWMRLLDTALPSPDDILEDHRLRPLDDERRYAVGPRSVVVLVGR
jgi:glycogen operon protein